MRHAQSEANRREVLASQQDYPLSEEGEAQALLIAKRFKAFLDERDKTIEHIIASPLLRAQQTARPFEEAFGVKLETNELIIEQHLGRYSGMSYLEIEDEPGYMHDRTKRWDWIPAGGGESYRMLAQRIVGFFSTLETNDCLCVTHAVTMRLMHAVLTDTLPDYPEWIPANGDIWEIDLERVGVVHSITTHHMIPELLTVSKA